MITSTFRRDAALAALRRVLAGERVEDAESDLVDFKEEAGTVVRGTRVPISSRHEPAAEHLAIEVACMANTATGGVLVVGVDDKGVGPSALQDTFLDTEWLRTRIAQLAAPSHSVDLSRKSRSRDTACTSSTSILRFSR